MFVVKKVLFLLVSVPFLCAMDRVSYSWDFLLLDTKKKIMACSDVLSQKKIKCVNRELSQITIQDLVMHSPLFLGRRDHICCMIQAADNNCLFVMKNLIDNAENCDHEDVLDWYSIFFQESKPISFQ